MMMATKSQPKKGKSAPKKKPPTSAPKKAAVAKKPGPSKRTKPAKGKAPAAKAHSLAEFVNMTYLTENGVKAWLKQGRLSGRQKKAGEWMIDAANLDAPYVKRLVR